MITDAVTGTGKRDLVRVMMKEVDNVNMGSRILSQYSPPRLQSSLAEQKEEITEGRELLEGEDLCEHICEIPFGRDELERQNFGLHLLAQPCHLDAEVAITCGDRAVRDHGHACLVVFEDD